MTDAAEDARARPLLRGWFHVGAAVAAVAGLVTLLLLADSPRAYAGGGIFATCLVLLYTTSATYHRITWGRRMRSLMKRLDHSMIFLLIGGTYTPFCLLVLDDAWGIPLLAVVWSVAAGGVALKASWPGAPRWLGVGLYAALGWLGLVAATQVLAWSTTVPLALLLAGGLLYSAGGVIYALRRPDPLPRVFGYHEVFHLLVVAGSALHYSLIAGWVVRA